MTRHYALLLPAIALLFCTCKKSFHDPGITFCLEQMIQHFKSDPSAWYILKYYGKKEPYYMLVTSKADFIHSVVDSDCNLICQSGSSWGPIQPGWECGPEFLKMEHDTIWHR